MISAATSLLLFPADWKRLCCHLEFASSSLSVSSRMRVVEFARVHDVALKPIHGDLLLRLPVGKGEDGGCLLSALTHSFVPSIFDPVNKCTEDILCARHSSRHWALDWTLESIQGWHGIHLPYKV